MRFAVTHCLLASLAAGTAAAQANVRIEPVHLQGPRILEQQTASAAIRDYLRAWRTLGTAMEQNRSDLLGAEFVGTAQDKLAETVDEQIKLGLSTHYQDQAHDIQIIFYSPEGLSIELIDTVKYDLQVLDGGKPIANQHTQARYHVILTPTAAQWKVRVFQGQSG